MNRDEFEGKFNKGVQRGETAMMRLAQSIQKNPRKALFAGVVIIAVVLVMIIA